MMKEFRRYINASATLPLLLGTAAVHAAGVAPAPPVYTRADWSARAPQCTMSIEPSLNRAVIHYSENLGENSTASWAETAANIRSIQNYHMDSNGWCDIGYNFCVDALGNRAEARYNSLTEFTRGAHDSVNSLSFGFCTLGNWDNSRQPPTVMREALYDLIAWRMPDGYTPLGSGTYGGKTTGFLAGHRDVISTTCPGDNLYSPYIATDYYGGEARLSVNSRITGGSGGGPTQMFVSSIVPSTVKSGNKKKGRAEVTIVHDLGGPIAGATVSGTFSGSYTQNVSGVTASNGTVTFTTTSAVSGTVSFQFCVTNVSGGTLTYNPSGNLESCDGL